MKRVYIIFVLCAVTLASLAQKFVAEAPSHVAVGEQFRLTYTINTQDASGFHVGNIPDALEVLMGPSTSSWSNIQIINGRTTATSSITYTYILCANKAGKYDIPAASISADGKKLTSNKLRITVSGSAGGGSSQAQSQRRGRQQIREAGSRISGSDLFIKVSASKKRVHEQEPILLTYKVYTLVGLLAYDGKMPDLKGFYTQEIKLPQPRTGQLEIVNGRQYNTLTICQYVMFPQKSGKLDIPSITFDIFTKQERFVDPFEAFFNGGSDYVEVKRKVKAPGLTIDVEPLPTRPADFSGGVGHFNISAQLNKQDVKANDPVTLRVTVSGVGNLKLVKTPVVNFPKDFDKYDD
ncbi:MAG: BatD family protein, partial [Prevotella sp.]|nr:BatD family protein [Prevotella sp.]